MNRWLLRILNVALLLAVLAAIPYGIAAYSPIQANNRAVDALRNKEYDRAIALLSEAIGKNPGNQVFKRNLLAAYNSKAIDLEGQGKDADAVTWYEKALSLEPQNPTILRNYVSTLNNLAVNCSNQKEYLQSQRYFERASSRLKGVTDAKMRDDVRHNYSALLTLWGAELMRRNQTKEAQRAFEEALLLEPKNAVSSIYLGDLFYEVNDYASSKKYYTAALPLDKDNSEYLKNRLQMIEDELQVESLFKDARDAQGRFLIQYVDYSGGTRVPQMIDMLNDARETIGKKLGIYPARAVSVKVYNNQDFYKISKLPEWAIGIFDGKMRLKLDDVQSAPSQVRDLLFHEYTHAVLAMNIRQRVPAWFHEGLAQLMEPQFAENAREQAQMRDALAKKRLDFNILQDSFKDIGSKQDAETAYLLSKYFLTYLNRKYGHDKLVAWIKELAGEAKFEDAFQKVYGVALKTAQDDWIRLQLRD